MIGYVVSTWYGKGGWGTRDYFFGNPGRYTLTEAFYFNNQTLTHQLETRFPKTARTEFNEWNIEGNPRLIGKLAASLGYRSWNNDVKDNVGLLWDRDTVAFYGDPAWEARLASRTLPFDQKLTVENGVYTFQIDASQDCSAARQPAMLLPHRIKQVEILQGEQFAPLVTDNFIILMKPGEFERGKTYRVVFRAERI
jgi:zinc protease